MTTLLDHGADANAAGRVRADPAGRRGAERPRRGDRAALGPRRRAHTEVAGSTDGHRSCMRFTRTRLGRGGASHGDLHRAISRARRRAIHGRRLCPDGRRRRAADAWRGPEQDLRRRRQRAVERRRRRVRHRHRLPRVRGAHRNRCARFFRPPARRSQAPWVLPHAQSAERRGCTEMLTLLDTRKTPQSAMR